MTLSRPRDDAAERVLTRRDSAAFGAWAEALAFWLLVGALAWAPFPLGSNRPWSWSLLTVFVAVTWFVWVLSVWTAPEKLRPLRRLSGPLALCAVAIIWALIQTSTWVPAAWVHPVWQLGQEFLRRPLQASISIDPWRTLTEAMKLGTYLAAGVLAYMMCQRQERAQRLLDALMIIGALYAGFAGPFVSHNNFATYAGLAVLCASVRLFDLGGRTLIVGRGIRQLTVSAIYFFFGVGALPAACFLVTFAMLMASGSRSGFIS